MKKRIIHFIEKPFDTITVCGVDVHGMFSSLDTENVNCKDCLKKGKGESEHG